MAKTSSQPMDALDHAELSLHHNEQESDAELCRVLEQQIDGVRARIREIQGRMAVRSALVQRIEREIAPRPDQHIDLQNGVVVTTLPDSVTEDEVKTDG